MVLLQNLRYSFKAGIQLSKYNAVLSSQTYNSILYANDFLNFLLKNMLLKLIEIDCFQSLESLFYP